MTVLDKLKSDLWNVQREIKKIKEEISGLNEKRQQALSKKKPVEFCDLTDEMNSLEEGRLKDKQVEELALSRMIDRVIEERRLTVGTYDPTTKKWNTDSGQTISAFMGKRKPQAKEGSFGDKEKKLTIGHYDPKTKKWSTESEAGVL